MHATHRQSINESEVYYKMIKVTLDLSILHLPHCTAAVCQPILLLKGTHRKPVQTSTGRQSWS